MTADDLRKALHRAPFQPFAIHTADGHKIEVPHPDFIALTGDGSTVIITSPQGHGITFLDILLPTRIEIPSSREKAK